ncbi:MAG TPA: glycosyltransferase family 4 protein [Xenococcaceae cyanobacterium]
MSKISQETHHQNLSQQVVKKQPKILFVDHTAVLGGAELSLLDLATAYAQTSKVVLFKNGPLCLRLQNAGVEVKITQASETMLNLRTSGGLNSLITIPELWKIAGQITQEAKNSDLILANSQKAFIGAALATLRGSPPVIWYLHDILTADHFSRLNRQVAVILANQFATRVLVNSEATGKAFVAAGGKAELVRVVYNGFHSEPFDQVSVAAAQQIRTQLKIDDAPLIGLFSRLSPWKGQHILLSAVKDLPQVHVMLVGDALFGEQEYVASLKSLAATPELQGRVHWLGFRNDIPTLMKACDMIVHTSTEPEPFGRVIVEAQLAQRPIIATAAGGALELVESEKTGLLFSPEDAQTLKTQIERLINDRPWATLLAQQGYESAKTNFAWTKILASFQQAIA